MASKIQEKLGMDNEEYKLYLEEMKERRKRDEEEFIRMSCGICNRCKTEKVKLYGYEVWDICDKCIKNI